MPIDITAKIAKRLLIQKGELYRSELAALPWIQDEQDIDLVIELLRSSCAAEIEQRKVKYSSIPEWEDVLVLIAHDSPTPAK